MQNQNDTASATVFDHTRFVVLRDALLDLLDRQAPDADADAQLCELLEHMRQQFAAEEQRMQAARFPACAAHKTEHDLALADFSERIGQWRERRDTAKLLDFVEAGLADWFVRHVNRRDYITARFIAGYRKME